jgi:hypothetical protein
MEKKLWLLILAALLATGCRHSSEEKLISGGSWALTNTSLPPSTLVFCSENVFIDSGATGTVYGNYQIKDSIISFSAKNNQTDRFIIRWNGHNSFSLINKTGKRNYEISQVKKPLGLEP